MKNTILFAIVTLMLFTSCKAVDEDQKPVNVIIFIGDGMGVSQVYSGMTASGNNMTFPYFPISGFSITYSSDDYITDSAAGGTALSAGEKTNNGMLAMRPDSSLMTTILELAKQNGLSTGVVSISSVTHATPASFATHASSRGMYEDIAKGYPKGTADVFIGGGKAHFISRKDSADLTVDLKNMGYDVVYTPEEMKKSASAHLAALLADVHMPYIAEGRDTNYLADATSKAIEILSKNPKGFVLMVEGSLIDFACHANDLNKSVDEVLDLDRAVKRAYEFATKDGKTLIVVTADHETGGLSIIGGSVKDKKTVGAFTTDGHSATMVPVFAFGPGAVNFTGVQQNTEINRKIEKLLSLK